MTHACIYETEYGKIFFIEDSFYEKSFYSTILFISIWKVISKFISWKSQTNFENVHTMKEVQRYVLVITFDRLGLVPIGGVTSQKVFFMTRWSFLPTDLGHIAIKIPSL